MLPEDRTQYFLDFISSIFCCKIQALLGGSGPKCGDVKFEVVLEDLHSLLISSASGWFARGHISCWSWRKKTNTLLQRFYLTLAALWKKENFSLDLNDVEVHSQIRFRRDQSELFYQCEMAENDGKKKRKTEQRDTQLHHPKF